MCKALVLTFCILCLPHCVFAQRKPSPTPTPKEVPAVEIEATTKDGKKVVLRSDGTWKYANSSGNGGVENTSAKADATLSLETGIIYQSGEVIPVARTTFYLLDDDVLRIVKNAKLQPSERSSRLYSDNLDEALISDISAALSQYSSLVADFVPRFLATLEPHVIRKFTTDFSGKATVNNLERKSYYLFGVGETRRNPAVWNLSIDLSKESHIILDQNNATIP